jgi:hypothetical protein
MPQISQTPETTIDRLRRKIQRAFDNIWIELDRIEILVTALHAFSGPVPDYEPGFRHQRHLTMNVKVLSQRAG